MKYLFPFCFFRIRIKEKGEGISVESLKAELDKARKENEALKTDLQKAKDENSKLKEVLAADKPDVAKLENQKNTLIKEILEHADLNADELGEMDIDELRLVKKTVGSFVLM
jgi:septal ring factor EnvC (AmiA/AmiB activator)